MYECSIAVQGCCRARRPDADVACRCDTHIFSSFRSSKVDCAISTKNQISAGLSTRAGSWHTYSPPSRYVFLSKSKNLVRRMANVYSPSHLQLFGRSCLPDADVAGCILNCNSCYYSSMLYIQISICTSTRTSCAYNPFLTTTTSK